jgi:hypothetical protein
MGKAVRVRFEFGVGHRLAGLRHETLSPTNWVDLEFAKVRLLCCGFTLILLTAINPVGTATRSNPGQTRIGRRGS